MFLDDSRTSPSLPRPALRFDWSSEKMPAYACTSADRPKKFDPQMLISWVKSAPTPEQVHVTLGNLYFTGERPLLRKLQAMGCTVTCRQYQQPVA